MPDPDYSKLPHGLRDGMQRYIENGAQVGHFLTAVLSNDLAGAVNTLNCYQRLLGGCGMRLLAIAGATLIEYKNGKEQLKSLQEEEMKYDYR